MIGISYFMNCLKTTAKALGICAFGITFQSVIAAEKLSVHIMEPEDNDLTEIIENRYFRVLTSRNAFDYHVYQGKQRGYQFELMQAFAKSLNKKYRKKGLRIQFELIPADYDQLIPLLLAGKGDMIAANLTVTPGRIKKVAFTKPLKTVKELIVTRKELADKDIFATSLSGGSIKVAARKSSSYYETIQSWNKSNPKRKLGIQLMDENLTPESIMELVSKRKADYALIDSHLFEAAQRLYPNLALAKEQVFEEKDSSLAIAVRKKSPKLLRELNQFIPKVRDGSRLGNIIKDKYFNDALLLKHKASEDGELSPYDELFKKYGKKYKWDWRLLAALCFQESRFNQDIINPWGAIGLFQVKQMTADEPYVGISDIRGPDKAERNIHAGVRYLSWIRDRYFKKLPQRRRIRLSLAAYNAGPRTVLRARKLTAKMGLDPNIWFRNVELAMAKMRKAEPVSYVSEINKRYVSYSLLLGE